MVVVLILLGITSALDYRKSPVVTEVSTASQETVATARTVVADDRQYGTPTRLAIPKIDVNTSITQVGLTSAGDMEAPQTDEDTGWYKYGPRPGNVGSAVIAGHLGLDGNAVFGDLGQLVKGDTLSVTDDQGQTVSFAVREVRKYGYDETPEEVFISTTGAHLNLITCEGNWEASQETYSQRLVVFTDKV